ncbi:MAG: MBL fold metallo-hydrolase [Cyanobacteria bacterium P01_F01_bin.143]
MGQEFYLKPNAIAEPLFNQWYAWSYLIPPATAAKYVVNSHIQIMESFINAPQVHVSALKNPAMIGGPFINYDSDRVWEIAALLEKTKISQKLLLDLDRAITELDQILQEIKDGISLESFYDQVPEIIRGYVELVYDRYNNPGIRFIEGLLYQSLFYDQKSQSIFFYLGNPDRRSFVLSTPRLASDQALNITLPFCDRRWDDLFQMRERPGNYQQIQELLSIPEEDNKLFSSLFSSQKLQIAPKYKGDEVRIRYFGHACVLIETKDVSILCDPLISNDNPEGVSRFSYADLPEKIDYALITHNHQDHVMFETL